MSIIKLETGLHLCKYLFNTYKYQIMLQTQDLRLDQENKF